MNWALRFSLAALCSLPVPALGASEANNAAKPADQAAAKPVAQPVGKPANKLLASDDLGARIAACGTCHGEQGRATNDGFYPRIAGKPAGYLYNQLRNFRDGRRKYPLMTYLLQHLSDEYLQEMANHFAHSHPPYPAPAQPKVSSAVLERGRLLVLQGDPAKQVPACVACHGQQLLGVAPAIPGLLGLPQDYLSAQFGAWQNGVRRAAAPDCMATITNRLSLDDIAAASAWLAAQPVPSNAAPATANTGTTGTPAARLPIACGSVEAKP